MCVGLRCNRLVPKEGLKQVSDCSGKRGEEEKVFTRWLKVGRTQESGLVKYWLVRSVGGGQRAL